MLEILFEKILNESENLKMLNAAKRVNLLTDIGVIWNEEKFPEESRGRMDILSSFPRKVI